MAVGVVVTTATRSAPATDQQVESSTYFVAGQTERGPSNVALPVASLGDYERLYGARVSYGSLYDDLATHFEEGGVQAYVARVVGASASVSSLTLVDKAGSPLNTLRIDAYGPGAWGQGVSVASAAGSVSGTYKLTIAYSGTGNTGSKVYDNLLTPADAVAALQNDPYVRATDLGSGTAAPNNQPAVLSATPLTSGSDDRGAINAARYTGALALFGEDLGTGIVAIPGQAASAVGTGLVAHAVSTNRLAAVAPAANLSLASAVSAEGTFASSLASGQEYVGFFWPWIKVPDGVGGTRTVSPEGAVAAKRAQTHERVGPAQSPIATFGAMSYVVDTETTVTKADRNTANSAKVSPLSVVNGTVELYGWRSLSVDDVNYHLLSARDTMNYVAVVTEDLMEEFVGRTIDGKGQLFSDMAAKEAGFLDGLRAAAQLYERIDSNGNQVDPGYRVDTGPAVNTELTKQANQANMAVSIRPAPSAELIQVVIAKVPVTGSV